MRSRYSAYALGLADYIMDTTGPGPHRQPDPVAWRESILAFSKTTQFKRLEVHEASKNDDQGVVEFTAHLVQFGQDASFRERSRFERTDRWRYVAGSPRPIEK